MVHFDRRAVRNGARRSGVIGLITAAALVAGGQLVAGDLGWDAPAARPASASDLGWDSAGSRTLAGAAVAKDLGWDAPRPAAAPRDLGWDGPASKSA